jgi:pimeloyl-ACP methyl ester carboxylesterase
VLAVVQVFVWRLAFASDAVPDHLHDAFGSRGRRGVVLIHGFICNRGLWNHWMRHLLRDRRAFVAVNLEPVFGGIDDYVPIVEDAVARLEAATGQPPLVIVHSMGGLATRAWMRADVRNVQRVCHVVTLGTPHHGTALRRGNGAWPLNGAQMKRHSAWLAELAADEQRQDSQGAGQGSRYQRFTCYWSNCDNIVFPAETATLPGADNRFEPGLAHLELALDSRIQAEVFKQFLLSNH